jgi:signal transduction histidine kinase
MSDAADEADRVIHLVDDLLVLSRVERGADFVVDEPLVLDHVVREAASKFTRGHGGVQPHVTAATSHAVARGEQRYVEQILDNLLRNAVKYGEPPIEIVVAPVDDGVSVRVFDSGPGFTAEPGALFDLYYREPGARTRASGGGIGLFVCRELARLMGGRVWAANRQEGGAEFGFVLPYYETEG